MATRYSLKALADRFIRKVPDNNPDVFRLKTSEGVVHRAVRDWFDADDNDARTTCGVKVHHCDLQACRHERRHKGRAFSRRTTEEVSCMACLTAPYREEKACPEET